MRELWKVAAGKIRPVALCFGIMLIVAYWYTVSQIKEVGSNDAIMEMFMSDVPTDIREAAIKLREHDTRMKSIEVLAHLLFGGFIGFISTLVMPAPQQQEEYSKVIKAAKAVEDAEKAELRGKVDELSTKMDTLKQALGD